MKMSTATGGMAGKGVLGGKGAGGVPPKHDLLVNYTLYALFVFVTKAAYARACALGHWV